MKTLSLSIILSTLVVSSQVFATELPDGSLIEPLKFMSCKLTRPLLDAGVTVTLLKERVGPAESAVISRISIAGRTDTVYPSLTRRPKLIEGDIAVGTVYSAHTATSSFELAVDTAHAGDDGTSAAVLNLDDATYEMLCQPYITVN